MRRRLKPRKVLLGKRGQAVAVFLKKGKAQKVKKVHPVDLLKKSLTVFLGHQKMNSWKDCQSTENTKTSSIFSLLSI